MNLDTKILNIVPYTLSDNLTLKFELDLTIFVQIKFIFDVLQCFS